MIGSRRPLLAVAVAVFLAVVGCTGGSVGQGVTIHVTPAASRRTQPVSVRVTGLTPHDAYTVTLNSTDPKGVRWESSARFRSGADGTLDLDDAGSDGGSYHGANRMGLMEALAPTHAPRALAYWWSGPKQFDLTITSSAGKRLAHGPFQRYPTLTIAYFHARARRVSTGRARRGIARSLRTDRGQSLRTPASIRADAVLAAY